MSVVGRNVPRPDGIAKVSGQERYADDFVLPGMLYGATVRSPHSHARIEAIRWRRREAARGAVFVTAEDLPGPNGVQLIDDSWPVLARGQVSHVGEAVALVAASTRLDALRSAEAVEVDYEPMTPVLTIEEALAHGLPLLAELGLQTGDVDQAFEEADVVVEGSYRTGHQEHIYIECQAVTAWLEGDGTLVVHGSMQCPYFVHKALVHALQIPSERVRVRASPLGGGFGGKEDYPSLIALHAALLARASGRPVRLAYDRHEDIVATTKRHPALIRHRLGANSRGELTAIEVDLVLDGGAFLTLSSVVLSRAVLHASGPYRCPNVRIRGRVVQTHTVPNGAFRGFGAPQGQFAIERQIDRLARRVGVDPYEIRARNVLEPGDRLPTGQVLDGSASARLCLETVQEKTGFRERWRQLEAQRRSRRGDEPMRGVGLSLYFHGAGFTGSGERRMRSPVTARLLEDGRIEVLTAATEMGQGAAVVLPQIAADAAGVPMEDVVFAPPDTGQVPDSGPTVASRTTMIVGEAVARAVQRVREEALGWWAQVQGLDDVPELRQGLPLGSSAGGGTFRQIARRYRTEVGPLEITVRHEPPAWQTFDDETYQGTAYPTFAWGADVSEVEIDPDTLEVRPLKLTAVCEVGRAIHPRLCVGQIEGGSLQAVGWALFEEIKVDGGRYLNDRLATYIIATARDSPEIEVHLLERPWEGGPFGAKGVGELPMDGGAPAVAQAVENASGLEVTAIPATPERLLEWHRSGRRVE